MTSYDITFIDELKENEKFLRVYKTYRQTMYHTASSILKDPWLIEDAVQEAFLKLVGNLHKLDESDPYKIRGFITKLTRNVAINILEATSPEVPTSDEELDELLPIDTDTPEFLLLDMGMSERMDRILKHMTEEHQEILEMVYLHGFKIGTAAELLGLPGSIARKRLQRAKKTLKISLAQLNSKT